MGINGISNYQLWDIPREIPKQKPVEETKLDISQNPSAQPQIDSKDDYAVIPKDNTLVNDNRSRVANLEDISLTFNKEESFGYIGSESGLADLDMQKAISDMKKDEVLQGYQYFVGSAQNIALQNSDDGAVFRKLGF